LEAVASKPPLFFKGKTKETSILTTTSVFFLRNALIGISIFFLADEFSRIRIALNPSLYFVIMNLSSILHGTTPKIFPRIGRHFSLQFIEIEGRPSGKTLP